MVLKFDYDSGVVYLPFENIGLFSIRENTSDSNFRVSVYMQDSNSGWRNASSYSTEAKAKAAVEKLYQLYFENPDRVVTFPLEGDL